eukprot:5959207-Pleurochrysis_carterae.AAC.1
MCLWSRTEFVGPQLQENLNLARCRYHAHTKPAVWTVHKPSSSEAISASPPASRSTAAVGHREKRENRLGERSSCIDVGQIVLGSSSAICRTVGCLATDRVVRARKVTAKALTIPRRKVRQKGVACDEFIGFWGP